MKTPGRLSRTLGALTLALALAVVSIVYSPAGAQTDAVYLALGDSIPAGVASSLPEKRGYPALLADLMQRQRTASDTPSTVELVNLSESGETVQSFIDDGQLQSALDAIEENGEDLRTVTLTLGGNDLLELWDMTGADREAELERFSNAYGRVVEQLSEALDGRDVDVVVTTYYDLTEGNLNDDGSDSWWLDRFNQAISDAAADAGFTVVRLEDVFRGEISSLTWFPADVHPNNAGHRAIAREIWQALDYDQSGPDIAITRPGGGVTRSRVPTIHAAVEDDVGVETVELRVDGEPAGELVHVDDLDVYVGLWDGREHSATEVELTVVATDLAGNESNDTVSITLPAR